MPKTSLVLERLGKWRVILAMWLFGSRAADTHVGQGMRDLAEKMLIMRAEMSATVNLMIEKKLFTQEEHQRWVDVEAHWLDAEMERRFAGFRVSPSGSLHMHDPEEARQTMEKLGFPP